MGLDVFGVESLVLTCFCRYGTLDAYSRLDDHPFRCFVDGALI